MGHVHRKHFMSCQSIYAMHFYNGRHIGALNFPVPSLTPRSVLSAFFVCDLSKTLFDFWGGALLINFTSDPPGCVYDNCCANNNTDDSIVKCYGHQ